MSILTCIASGEEAAASLSSCNMNNDTIGAIFYTPQHHLITLQNQNPPQQIKKKRNQPGNPDPEAEVIALSPKTLVARNRFFCEICNKGFQRDQNLQLHRRGHNLPWKLKKRENKEVVRRKVYVCPESSCVHHDPSRALGDLTGIKKHFSRKHGEKKWKCEKCSKSYAVQSDCKAHSKTCGTKQYKCECGTPFSRRDSFITHRAFCDTLAVESTRSAITGNNPIIFQSEGGTNSTSHMNLQFQPPHYFSSPAAAFSMKKEQPISDEIPPWLMTICQPFVGANPGSGPGPGPPSPADFSSSIFQSMQSHQQEYLTSTNFHDNLKLGGEAASSPYISATALLQKGGNKTSGVLSADTGSGSGTAMLMMPHKTHMSVTATKQTDNQNLFSREELTTSSSTGLMINTCLGSYGNKAAITSGVMPMTSFFSFEEDAFNGTLSETNSFSDEDMTKDFLGLRPLSHSDDINFQHCWHS